MNLPVNNERKGAIIMINPSFFINRGKLIINHFFLLAADEEKCPRLTILTM